MVFDDRDDLLFADFTNHHILFLNRGTTSVTRFGVAIPAGAMSVIAGDGFIDGSGIGRFGGDGGPATEASLNFPRGLALDTDGNLYFDDIDNQRVRRIDVQTGIISTVAGNGTQDLVHDGDGGQATEASVRAPTSVAFDAAGDLYISEFTGTIRKVDGDGIISTIAGTASWGNGYGGDGGPAVDAVIGQNPKSLTFDTAGNLFVADAANDRVRRIDAHTSVITTVAGPGLENVFHVGAFSADDVDVPATDADLSTPTGLAFRDGHLLVSSEEGSQLWTIDPGVTDSSTVARTSVPGRSSPAATSRTPRPSSSTPAAPSISPRNRAVLYRADPTGAVSPLAGTGVFPLSIDGPGGDPRDDLGDGGPVSAATVSPWVTLALGPGSDVYLADWGSRRIRRIDALPSTAGELPMVGPTSTIETVVRNPFPSNAVAVADGKVYFEDAFGHTVWRFDPDSGERVRFAGTGKAGSSGDGGPARRARLRCVVAMAVDRVERHLFLADPCSGDVRVIDLRTGVIDTAIDTTRGTLRPLRADRCGGPGQPLAVRRRGVLRDGAPRRSPGRPSLGTRVAGIPYIFTPGYTGDDTSARVRSSPASKGSRSTERGSCTSRSRTDSVSDASASSTSSPGSSRTG